MKSIVVKLGYKSKFYNWRRFLQPFVSILDGIIDIVLLPTPYVSYLSIRLYRAMIKTDAKKRTKEFENR